MSGAWLRHTWRAHRWRLAIVAVALVGWGALLPIIFDAFGEQFQTLMDSGAIPSQLARFGGGDIFSLAGSISLGYIHPIAIGLMLVFAVGFAASSLAGERQHGTLEILLARPVSRRGLVATVLVASALFVIVTSGAQTLGALVGTAIVGRVDELGAGNLPILWLNAALLFGAFAAISVAASASFDRLTPALGLSLGFVLVSYFLDTVGQLWPDAAFLQTYALPHYLDVRAALAGLPDPTDFAVLGAVIAIAITYTMIVFPRRDLAAPS
jgi:beta-exotoxin I transport system permease protein